MFLAALVLVGVVAGLWHYLSRSAISAAGAEGPGKRPPARDQRSQERLDLQAAATTEIDLYGKVVDQDGAPVPEAVVDYQSDNLGPSQTGKPRGTLQADAGGLFEIHGLTGATLFIEASKAGYAMIADRGDHVTSSRAIEFGLAADKGMSHRNSAARVTLTLERKGFLEELTHVGKRWQPLKPNGRWLRIFIGNEEGRYAIDFSLKVDGEAKILGGAKTAYAWQATVRALRGKVQMRESLGYLAPETGYEEEIRIGASEPLPGEEWRGVRKQDFYVRFEDDTYARISCLFSGDNDTDTLFFESWHNPQAGSRQLAPGLGDPIRRIGEPLEQP